MYLSSAVATFATVTLFGLASADCYSTGMVANSDTMNFMKEDAQLTTICSALTGTYDLNEKRYTCLEAGTEGRKYDFELKYAAKAETNFGLTIDPAKTREIKVDECKDGMKKELGCSRGGKTMYTNWEYRADYNLGKCTQPFGKRTESDVESVRRSHGRDFVA